MGEQLDLFSWVRPRNVVVFPLCARSALVREAVRVFRTLQPGPAMAHWRKVQIGLTADLASIGTPPEEIDREIAAFSSAVIAEMGWAGDGQRTGGDAA